MKMGKVKLTKEQAEATELYLEHNDEDVEMFLWAHARSNWTGPFYEPLNGLSQGDLARALLIGYEIGPEIKIGDFVDIGLFGISKIAEVTGVKGDTIAINGSDEYHEFKINRVLTDEEKQEEKQRRWWAENGREVWELKEGDVLKDIYQREIHEVVGIGFMGSVMFEGDTSYRAVDEIEIKCTVVCFVEDRKDVDHD